MSPGTKLDALVAEKVMAWKPRRVKRIGYGQHDDQFVYYTNSPRPKYSTEISAAWMVFEKLGRAVISTCGYGTHPWVVTYWEGGVDFHCAGTTAPHAICLAALKAVGAL